MLGGAINERRAALFLMLCSTLVGFTGNFFLSFIGVMTGAMHYFNNNSAPDLMFMLSFVTAMLGMVYLFSVLSFGTLLFFVSPERVCGVSSSVLDRVSNMRKELPGSAGFPWNSTEVALGHDQHYNDYGHHYPKTVSGLEQVNAIVCGENGASFILLFGFLVLCFALCIVTPIISIALRFTKQAQRNGGCQECGPPRMVMVVQGRNGQYHQVVEQYPGEFIPQRHGQQPAQGVTQGQMVRTPDGDMVHTTVPVAVPVRQPSSVTVASAVPAAQSTVTGAATLAAQQPVAQPPVARAEAVKR